MSEVFSVTLKRALRRRSSSKDSPSAQLSISFSPFNTPIPPISREPVPRVQHDELEEFVAALDGCYTQEDLRIVREVLFVLVEKTKRYDLIEQINQIKTHRENSTSQMTVNSQNASFIEMHHNSHSTIG